MTDATFAPVWRTFFVDTETTPLRLDRGRRVQEVFIDTPTTSLLEHPVSDEVRDVVLPVEWASRYRIRERIGVSGQATLWLAEAQDSSLVVIRRAYEQSVREEHRLALAQLAQLRHPHIVRAVEPPLEREPYRWELLEYCSQRSVANVQRSGGTADGPRRPLPPDFIRTVVSAVAEALRYLHQDMQVLHTDIKPDNILVRGDGTVVLGDFSSAINRLQVPVGSDTGRTTQYAPGDDWFSEAWDWAQLGLSVLTLTLGLENPAHRRHEVDYDALDPRLSLLVRGLLVREPHQRWGYTDVTAWLRGEDVPIRGTDPAARRTALGFLVHVLGQPCNTPDELGDLLSRRWVEAVRVIQGPSPDPNARGGAAGGESWLGWLARELGRIGDGRATEVARIANLRIGGVQDQALGGRVTAPEHALAQLVTCLNPHGIPRYGVTAARAVALIPPELATIAYEAATAARAGDEAHESVVFMERLFQRWILTAHRGMEGFEWLAHVDDAWHTAHAQVGQALARAARGAARSRRDYQRRLRAAGLAEDQMLELREDDWERYRADAPGVFGTLIAANLLQALVDPSFGRDLVARARAARDSDASVEPWFDALAHGRRAANLDADHEASTTLEPAPAPPRATLRGALQRFVASVTRRFRRG